MDRKISAKRYLKQRLIQLFIFATFFFFVERFCHKQTHGFRPHKIHAHISHRSEWEVHSLSQNQKAHVDEILKQPFYFLESGGECYVFLSQDNQYVIKFFKHHHMRKNPLVGFLPLPQSLKKYMKRSK